MNKPLRPNEEFMLECYLYQLVSEEEREQRKERIRREQRLSYLRRHSTEAFLESEGFFTFDKGGKITSRELYALYCLWCDANGVFPDTERTFFLNMKEMAPSYNLCYSMNIPLPGGKHARGFLGLMRQCPLPSTHDTDE